MRYFNDCKNPEEAKVLYKQLCKQYHPDKPGGDLQIQQELQMQYNEYLKDYKNFNNSTYTKEQYEFDVNEIKTFVESLNIPEANKVIAGVKKVYEFLEIFGLEKHLDNIYDKQKNQIKVKINKNLLNHFTQK